jgi:hypothetical protein
MRRRVDFGGNEGIRQAFALVGVNGQTVSS